jgi:hypothetical protein
MDGKEELTLEQAMMDVMDVMNGETEQKAENKETRLCNTCGQTKPIIKFASHVDKKKGERYHRRQCRDCANADWRKKYGKPKGILKHLSDSDVDKIKSNADLFGKVSSRRFYEICEVPVSLGTWYRAIGNGDIANIIQGPKEPEPDLA